MVHHPRPPLDRRPPRTCPLTCSHGCGLQRTDEAKKWCVWWCSPLSTVDKFSFCGAQTCDRATLSGGVSVAAGTQENRQRHHPSRANSRPFSTRMQKMRRMGSAGEGTDSSRRAARCPDRASTGGRRGSRAPRSGPRCQRRGMARALHRRQSASVEVCYSR